MDAVSDQRLKAKVFPVYSKKGCTSFLEEVAFRLWHSDVKLRLPKSRIKAFVHAERKQLDAKRIVLHSDDEIPHGFIDVVEQCVQSTRVNLQEVIQSRIISVAASVDQRWKSAGNEKDLQFIVGEE